MQPNDSGRLDELKIACKELAAEAFEWARLQREARRAGSPFENTRNSKTSNWQYCDLPGYCGGRVAP
jgi:hypothetical protein